MSGESGISAYDNDRKVLQDRLEKNVDQATLQRAKERFEATKS